MRGVFVYVADTDFNVVRRVDTTTGNEIVVAGVGNTGFSCCGRFSGDGGPATAAELDLPAGVALDGAGNLLIADGGNQRVRRVDAGTGTITTVAGNGTAGFSGDGGPATAAELAGPAGVALDGAGNLFIADSYNGRVRRVDAGTGTITTVAGNGTQGFGDDGGPATAAELCLPSGVALDGAGNLFIAECQRIRRVDVGTGTITTVAGNGTYGFGGDGGPATAAELFLPSDVALDGAGNLFIADSDNRRVRRVDAGTGTITTVAGNGTYSFGGDGGPATAAELAGPTGVALDGAGNLFIADPGNARVRRVDAGTGTITTVAGNGTVGFGGDGGPATAAELAGPAGIALDGAGNLFIADESNARVRRVDAGTGTITTVAGNGTQGFSGDGGPATAAELSFPAGVALDGGGNLLIADGANQRIRRVDAGTGAITTVAGNGTFGFSGDGGPATAAELSFPAGVALDGAGNLFIADGDNFRIRRVQFCGDGVVDPGEECDDGAANGTAASCCTFTCTYQLPNTPCSGGSCDGSDVCVATTTTTTTSTSAATMATTTTSTTTSTTTTRPPRTTTLLRCGGGVFPACSGTCPVGMRCHPFGRMHSCVCR